MPAFFLFNSPRPSSVPTTFFDGAKTKKILMVGIGRQSSCARVAAKVVVPT